MGLAVSVLYVVQDDDKYLACCIATMPRLSEYSDGTGSAAYLAAYYYAWVPETTSGDWLSYKVVVPPASTGIEQVTVQFQYSGAYIAMATVMSPNLDVAMTTTVAMQTTEYAQLNVASISLQYCPAGCDSDENCLATQANEAFPGYNLGCRWTRACIQELNISHCRLVTDRAMFLISNELWIEYLDISYCPRISDEGLGMVLKSSPGILSLNVAWCRKISDRTIDFLREHNKSLQFLNVTALDGVGSASLGRLKEKNKILTVVNEKVTAKGSGSGAANKVEEKTRTQG